MNVTGTPISASLRVTDMQDETIQSFHRIRHSISLAQSEIFLNAVGLVRGGPVGNGFLTVTTELAEA